MSNPFDALHTALASAVHRDMPDVEYETRDWNEYKKDKDNIVMIRKVRRPYVHELEVDMFPQGWGSTALGYPGIGGQAMTSAYTVVISYEQHKFCVYFGAGGALAYYVDLNMLSRTGRDSFMNDLHDHCMADVQKAITRYV